MDLLSLRKIFGLLAMPGGLTISLRLNPISLMKIRLFVLALVSLSSLLVAAIAAPIQPVTAPGLPVVSGAGNSFTPGFSPDGQFVAFVSQARNLLTNDGPGPYLAVYLRDLANHRTTLVSVTSRGISANGNCNFPTVSSNGQFVAFESAASNLAFLYTNGTTDVFVRDLAAARTTLVSIGTNGLRNGNGPSWNPTITPDGRWVVFESSASDLVGNDTNSVADVFVWDRLLGKRMVSYGLANPSSMPSITPDGRFVAFVNTISNTVPPPLSLAEIYVSDLQSNTLVQVSAPTTNFFPSSQLPIRCLQPVLSADGRFVAYKASP